MKVAALIRATIITAIAAASQHALADQAPEMEKCYGIAKAGKNDCKTKSTSCAGTAPMDRQADAFLVLPKGICGKIAGGQTDTETK